MKTPPTDRAPIDRSRVKTRRRASVRLCWLPLCALTAITLVSELCRAEEYERFTSAKNAFDAGEYDVAAARFDEFLGSGPQNPAAVIEAHKLAGVSYLFLSNREAAAKHFEELLNIAPKYALDPLDFPIDVVDFFAEIKQRNKAHLEELARARATEAERLRREEEARRLAEIERLTRHVYLERNREIKSRLVAFLPLGAGQFQNGHTLKGALFLSGELLFGAAAIVTYFLHDGLRERAAKPFESAETRQEFERLEAGYRVANQVSISCFAGLAVIGIIDALVYFREEKVSWRPLDEGDVPDEHRPDKARQRDGLEARIAPVVQRDGVGLAVAGTF